VRTKKVCIEYVRTKKVCILEKKKLMREDGGGDAAVRFLFLKQTDGEHMMRKCVVSSVSEGFLIDFCPFVALFMISTLI